MMVINDTTIRAYRNINTCFLKIFITSFANLNKCSCLTSTDTLRDICNAVPIPVNAIGGLNKDNIDVLTGIPIAGICVVSAIMKADDPKKAAAELKARAQELGLC